MNESQITDNINNCDQSICMKSMKKKINKSPKHHQNTTNKAVYFCPGEPGGGARREKYLTAKYGAHQMGLIRKRLKVEMWMFDQLQILCQSEVLATLGAVHMLRNDVRGSGGQGLLDDNDYALRISTKMITYYMNISA